MMMEDYTLFRAKGNAVTFDGKSIVNLSGGMNTWLRAGLPVEG